MSSILLSNPFVTPVPPPQNGPTETANTQVIAAAQSASGSNGAGNATSYSGSGGGYGTGKGSDNPITLRAALDRGAPVQLSDASPKSVVDAQSLDGRTPAPAFGANLPEVEMPDPLPTSPFLLALRGD